MPVSVAYRETLEGFEDIWCAATVGRKHVVSDLLVRLNALLEHVREQGFFTLRIWGVLIQGVCNLQLRQLDTLIKSCELYLKTPMAAIRDTTRRTSAGGRHRSRTDKDELAESLDVNFTQGMLLDNPFLADSSTLPFGATQAFATPTLNRLAAALEAGLSPRDVVEDVFALPPVDGDSFMAELRRLSAEFTPLRPQSSPLVSDVRDDGFEVAFTPKRARKQRSNVSPSSSGRRRRSAVQQTSLEDLPISAFMSTEDASMIFKSIEYFANSAGSLDKIIALPSVLGNLPKLLDPFSRRGADENEIDILRDDQDLDIFSAYPRRISVVRDMSPSPVKRIILSPRSADPAEDLLATLTSPVPANVDNTRKTRAFAALVTPGANSRRAAARKFVSAIALASQRKVELMGSDFLSLVVCAVSTF